MRHTCVLVVALLVTAWLAAPALAADGGGVGEVVNGMVKSIVDIVQSVVAADETGGNLLFSMTVNAPLPCLVTIQKGAYEPRYPTLKGMMAARMTRLLTGRLRLNPPLFRGFVRMSPRVAPKGLVRMNADQKRIGRDNFVTR